jgi:Fe-S cluster biogenesis protein NfuA
MKKEGNTEDKIKELIENIRPYLNMDGGDIEYIKYEDNYVYIKLYGACTNCLLQDNTINDGLLTMFQDEIPEIKGIINIPL